VPAAKANFVRTPDLRHCVKNEVFFEQLRAELKAGNTLYESMAETVADFRERLTVREKNAVG